MKVKHSIFILFLFALIIRIALFAYISSASKVIFQPDSKMYFSLAKGLLSNGSFSYMETPQILNAERMPGYPIFLAVLFSIFGENLLIIVVIQIILDALTCLLIYRLGEHFWEGSGFLSGLLASINLGMITYAHFILSDTLFLFAFVSALIFFMKLMKRAQSKDAVLFGLFLGLATLIRPVSAYLPLLIVPFLIIYFLSKSKLAIGIASKKAIWIIVVFILTLSPWLIRNYIHYNRFKLSSQEGEHLLQYIVPFSWQYSKGISFIEGMRMISDSFNQKIKKERLDFDRTNPFEVSDMQMKMAMEYLNKEPKTALVKAWLFGMAKNLFSPAIIDFSYLLNIERPHFFYTEGKNVLDRCWNFIAGMKGPFGWVVVFSMIGIVLLRLVQLWGLVRLFRSEPWECGLVVLIIGYFLLISGPVGYAKYRLPFEPVLIVLLAIGIKDLYQRWVKRDFSQSERKN